MAARGLCTLGAFLLCGCLTAPVQAQVLLSQDEALALAYPAADLFDRRTAFLSDEDAGRVEDLTGEDFAQRVVTYYVAMRGDEILGVAYFDVHRVRTLREVLMVALDAQGTIHRLEVLSFAEPREYLAPGGWMALFQGRGGTDPDALRGDVPNITGATLTSHAVKDSATRALALHRVIHPTGPGQA